jgi:RES domain
MWRDTRFAVGATRVSAGTFVVKNDPDELLEGRLRRKFDATYGELVKEFREFLIAFPMLGADHPFGKVLSKAMKRAQRTALAPATWCRATRNTAEPSSAPRAALESIRANRYNQIGQAAWYLASDEKTAAVEVIRRRLLAYRSAWRKFNSTTRSPCSICDQRSGAPILLRCGIAPDGPICTRPTPRHQR